MFLQAAELKPGISAMKTLGCQSLQLPQRLQAKQKCDALTWDLPLQNPIPKVKHSFAGVGDKKNPKTVQRERLSSVEGLRILELLLQIKAKTISILWKVTKTNY